MFCASNRLFPDPEDTCVCCAGTGMRRWFDADCGWIFDPCPACDGIALAGEFVLQLATGEMRLEARWHGKDFAEAIRRAHRLANHARAKLSRYAVNAEARVIYKPVEPEPDECVYAVNVWRAVPLRAA